MNRMREEAAACTTEVRRRESDEGCGNPPPLTFPAENRAFCSQWRSHCDQMLTERRQPLSSVQNYECITLRAKTGEAELKLL